MPNNFVIAPVMVNYVTAGKSAYLYNINGEIVDKSYLLIPDVNVGVDRAGQIKKSTLYRLTEKAQQERYDLAVDNAQKLLTNKNTSIAAVKQASWQIKYDQSKLDGQKVWVKNMNKLTKAEKSWVVSLANCDIHGDLQKEYAGFYKGKIAVVTYNKKTFKSELVRYLKLSDYATDK